MQADRTAGKAKFAPVGDGAGEDRGQIRQRNRAKRVLFRDNDGEPVKRQNMFAFLRQRVRSASSFQRVGLALPDRP